MPAVRIQVRLLEAAEPDAAAGKARDDAVDVIGGRCEAVELGNHKRVTVADEIHGTLKSMLSASWNPAFLF